MLACSQADSCLAATQLKIYHLLSLELPGVGLRMRHEFSNSSHPLALQTFLEDCSDSHASKGFCKYSSLKKTWSWHYFLTTSDVPAALEVSHLFGMTGTEKSPACCNATCPFLSCGAKVKAQVNVFLECVRLHILLNIRFDHTGLCSWLFFTFVINLCVCPLLWVDERVRDDCPVLFEELHFNRIKTNVSYFSSAYISA